jgi:hypothetical protein
MIPLLLVDNAGASNYFLGLAVPELLPDLLAYIGAFVIRHI